VVDLAAPLHRILPEPGETTVAAEIGALDLAAGAHDDRPYTITNFALTVDGKATIDGRSGPIGTDTDTAMLVGLRTRVDALMIGAGTMRTERYGRVIGDPQKRAQREEDGLAPDVLVVLVSKRLDLPWDADLFTDGNGSVLVFTASDEDPPDTATEVSVVRHEGTVDLVEAMRHLRVERGVRALLSEGGPHLHAQMIEADLVDDLFVTTAAKLGGGAGPGLAEGLPEVVRDLELTWLATDAERRELFQRYRLRL
jgi:riboflavin biosynthesis pyrimidine reductase